VRLKLTISVNQYDHFYAVARRADISIPEAIRRQLPGRRRRARDDEDDQG